MWHQFNTFSKLIRGLSKATGIIQKVTIYDDHDSWHKSRFSLSRIKCDSPLKIKTSKSIYFSLICLFFYCPPVDRWL